jgi:phosphonatase-like hydrolase
MNNVLPAVLKLVVFDLSGTTICDDNAVAKCLYSAAVEHGLSVSLDDFRKTIGTNKIKLYAFMIARNEGHPVSIADLEVMSFPEYHDRAMEIFRDYSVRMVNYYRREVRPMPGAEDVFRWCHDHGILVATDTGFHSDVSLAIEQGLRWQERGLVDLALDVEDTDGVGRPAPYMIHLAMRQLDVQSVHQVVKIGDTPADLLSGYNAGCRFNIGVLSGANGRPVLSKYPHTHIIPSVEDLPELLSLYL